MILEALLQGFAAFASVIGVASAYIAFQACVSGGFDQSNPRLSEAINVGVAAFFLLALVLGAIVVSYVTTL